MFYKRPYVDTAKIWYDISIKHICLAYAPINLVGILRIRFLRVWYY